MLNVGGSETLGHPIPPSDGHAIIVSLPTWRDNVGLVEDEARVMQALTTAYPRIYPHNSVQKLTRICEEKFAVNGDKCDIYPSKRIAEECRKYMLGRAAQEGTLASVKLAQYTICPEVSSGQTRQSAELHLVLYPATIFMSGVDFWRCVGLGISSRFAEHCLSLLPGQDKQDPNSPGAVSQSSSTILPPEVKSKDQSTYPGEPHSPLGDGAFAKHVLRRRIAGLLTGNIQDAPQGPYAAGSAQNIEIESSNGSVQDVCEDDVFLFPTGMAAIWYAHQLCLRARPPAKSVCLGFLYADTIKVLEDWGPGVHFFGHGLDSDIDALERLLAEEFSRDPTKPPVLALVTETPSNPLLRSVDLHRLRALADTYDFLLIIDDTVGNFVNVEVLPYADIVVTSLTKIFSGAANVMGGSLVFNSKGRHYAALKSHMDTYEDTYFDEDAVVMEQNSRDLVHRVRIIDENAEALCELLRSRSAAEGAPSAVIKEVFYPKYQTPSNYLQSKRPEGGYGGLLSLTFTSLAASETFFDALPCYKGTNIGTNFTLVGPYTLLAFHNHLEWAAQYGLEEGLVRISVGVEEKDWLLRSFSAALKGAESAQLVPS